MTLNFSKKVENLGQFFKKWGKRGLNINFLAKFTIMKKKYMKNGRIKKWSETELPRKMEEFDVLLTNISKVNIEITRTKAMKV